MASLAPRTASNKLSEGVDVNTKTPLVEILNLAESPPNSSSPAIASGSLLLPLRKECASFCTSRVPENVAFTVTVSEIAMLPVTSLVERTVHSISANASSQRLQLASIGTMATLLSNRSPKAVRNSESRRGGFTNSKFGLLVEMVKRVVEKSTN